MTKKVHRLTSLQGAADYLNVSPRTIRRMIAAGEITGFRVGKKILRIDLEEIDAILSPIPSGASL